EALRLAENTMNNTDLRIQSGKSVTPYFFMASLLWPALQRQQELYIQQGMAPSQALQQAADKILHQQIKSIAIPKRFTIPMRELWLLQPRLLKTTSKKTTDILSLPRFRAAYDFLA